MDDEQPLSNSTGMALSSSPDTFLPPTDPIPTQNVRRRRSSDASMTPLPHHSPTLSRSYNDPEARERQRTMDVDMAMQLSRARRETVLGSPELLAFPERLPHEEGLEHVHLPESAMQSDVEDEVLGPSPNDSRIDLTKMHLSTMHDASLLAHAQPPSQIPRPESLYALPTYQADALHSDFDFGLMEEFAVVEKATLGIQPTTRFTLDTVPPRRIPPPLNPELSEAGPSNSAGFVSPPILSPETDGEDQPRSSTSTARQRKLSHSNPHPRSHRKGIAGKMALFENAHDPFHAGHGGLSLSSRIHSIARQPTSGVDAGPPPALSGILNTGHDRPYRFSFYSNALAATIHARSLSELPADGQTFQQLFTGIHPEGSREHAQAPPPLSRDFGFPNGPSNTSSGNGHNNKKLADHKMPMGPTPPLGNGNSGDSDDRTWWLDVLSPTDEEMKMLSKACAFI
ncbi:hypothetical protein H0H93_016621 [Arthromyces matolae]|nr:hypothetical protein H0H93_016621 [Arthromyces matolae]